MPVIPKVDDPAAFQELLFRAGQWADAIAAIRQKHQLGDGFAQSRDGSTVVFLSDARCIKLAPPFPGFVASQRREVEALRCIGGGLPIATPELVATGEIDGWPYFVATRLAGRPIDAVWDDLDRSVRIGLATRLGEAIRALHRVRSEPVASITDPWPGFRAQQRARCMDLERSKGLAPDRLAELERYLERLDRIAEPSPAPALLHTEIGPSHVLVQDGRITGLIDFGDAMVGDPEYDLAPVGMFVTRGDRAAFRAFSEAYGQSDDTLRDPDRPARLLRHALLHRYGTLAWYLERLTPPPGTLDDLAKHWFGID